MKPRYQHLFTVVVAGMLLATIASIYLERRRASATADKIADLEGRALAAWRDIVDDAGETWNLAEVDRVDREVLPTWREARRLLNEARSGKMSDDFPAEMEDFFRLREESWTALVRSVRENDDRLYKRHAELFAEADRVGNALKQRLQERGATGIEH